MSDNERIFELDNLINYQERIMTVVVGLISDDYTIDDAVDSLLTVVKDLHQTQSVVLRNLTDKKQKSIA